MQPVDFTTLRAACSQLRTDWIPARLEQVYQRDRHTLSLALRTLQRRGWLTLCWHHQGARLCLGDPPPRTPDTFTFSDQLRHQLKGFALIAIEDVAPWERVLDLQFAHRPGESPQWHLYLEIMGRYSNVILTDAQKQIVTVAHQVSERQSSVRPLQTGQPYELPPALVKTVPSLEESQEHWQHQVSLVPGEVSRQLLKIYRGLSPTLASAMVQAAGIDPKQSTEKLTPSDWQRLFQRWQEWLQCLQNGQFKPGLTPKGYTVLGWNMTQEKADLQGVLNGYYTQQLNQERFQQLRHQLRQKVSNVLKKLGQKADKFRERLHQSDGADEYRQQADLLMAYLQEWQPGMKAITLTDFTTGEPVKIPLNPEKNGVQNAQLLYKRHQKLKRSRNAVEPLLQEVDGEIHYLEQVEDSLNQLEQYRTPEDLKALEEVREELIEQHYLRTEREGNLKGTDVSKPYRYQTPSGFELWIGRNNRQNDQLTFRTAGDYDLWFHTQEIAGSHVLLRLDAGTVPEETDLQFAADMAAFHSRACQSEQVPVIYTRPKHVYKPKGAKPGMVIYKQEQVIWGCPQRVLNHPLQGLKS